MHNAVPQMRAPEAEQRAAIASLNDRARAGTLTNARTVFTRTLIEWLAGDDYGDLARARRLRLGQAALLRAMNETPIDPGNDPHGEHDFGVIEFRGTRIYWKIDVYQNDGTLQWGAETPWDESSSTRIVTLMLPSDY